MCVFKFLERFSYHGIRSVLAIYLGILYGDEYLAVVAYHGFKSTTYAMSLLGGYLADTWIGKFNAIIVLTLISLTGIIILTFSSINPDPAPDNTQK